MSPTIQQVRFLSFCIKAKQAYANSVLIGSLSSISKKIGVTDHQCRTYIRYGLKNDLIQRTGKRYQLPTYKNAILHLDCIKEKQLRHYKFNKKGSFEQISESILFKIASQNFKTQQFHINRRRDLRHIEASVRTGQRISRREYNFLNKYKTCLNDSHSDKIITGQKHLSKLLGVSQKFANDLLRKWHELKLIVRKVVYLSYDYSTDYCLHNFKYCKGSILSLCSNTYLK